jgi:hypothetical protein
VARVKDIHLFKVGVCHFVCSEVRLGFWTVSACVFVSSYQGIMKWFSSTELYSGVRPPLRPGLAGKASEGLHFQPRVHVHIDVQKC